MPKSAKSGGLSELQRAGAVSGRLQLPAGHMGMPLGGAEAASLGDARKMLGVRPSGTAASWCGRFWAVFIGVFAVVVCQGAALADECAVEPDKVSCFCDAGIQTLGLEGVYVGRIERPHQSFMFRVAKAFQSEGQVARYMAGDVILIDDLPTSFSFADLFLAYFEPYDTNLDSLVLFRISDGEIQRSVALDASTSPIFSCSIPLEYEVVARALLSVDCRAAIYEAGVPGSLLCDQDGCSAVRGPGLSLFAALGTLLLVWRKFKNHRTT